MELRWVERYEPAPQYGDDISVTVRVLQCRVDPSQGLGHWLDWQDVPVVRDTQE